jgi:hypothetical protein
MTSTTTAAIAAIDPLDQQEMRDIIAEETAKVRGRLMTICNDIIPNQIISKDRSILGAILLKTGHMDLNEKDLKAYFWGNGKINSNKWSCYIDDDGHIRSLNLSSHNADPFDLPPSIILLVRLTRLSVQCCRLLPVELSKLQNLQSLHLDRRSELVINFPFQMELRKLEMIHLDSTSLPESTSSPFFVWLTTKLPSLIELGFCNYYIGETSRILDFLQTVEETRFKDNLKSLIVFDCNQDWNPFGTLFQTLMLNILPRFPNLDSMRLNGNNIESVQPIVEKSETEQTVVSTLRVLSIYDTSVIEISKDDPKERAAAMSLVKTYSYVYNLGGKNKEDYPSDLEYELRLNHAGRGRLVGKGVGNNDRPIPLSLWPTILERAYEKSDKIYDDWYSEGEKNATRLYYLLREGPALLGRTELFSGGGGGGGGAVVENDERKNSSLKQKNRKTSKMPRNKKKPKKHKMTI